MRNSVDYFPYRIYTRQFVWHKSEYQDYLSFFLLIYLLILIITLQWYIHERTHPPPPKYSFSTYLERMHVFHTQCRSKNELGVNVWPRSTFLWINTPVLLQTHILTVSNRNVNIQIIVKFPTRAILIARYWSMNRQK